MHLELLPTLDTSPFSLELGCLVFLLRSILILATRETQVVHGQYRLLELRPIELDLTRTHLTRGWDQCWIRVPFLFLRHVQFFLQLHFLKLEAGPRVVAFQVVLERRASPLGRILGAPHALLPRAVLQLGSPRLDLLA